MNLRIINGLQCGLDVFYALTCGISHAGEILQLTASMFFGRVSSALWSVSTTSLPSPHDAPDLYSWSPSDLRTAYTPPAPYLLASVPRPRNRNFPLVAAMEIFLVFRRPVKCLTVGVDPQLAIVDPAFGVQPIGSLRCRKYQPGASSGPQVCLS